MTGLFSPVELQASAGPRAGFRLHRLEIHNWGTFHRRVWKLALDGDNCLLTGDIGSGKSTLVDALTTLLLPANKIDYNKAAGAEKRERNLRSYVLGYYKSERNEVTETSRPVGLRGAGDFSVILGVFGNEGYDSTITLAQVFHWGKGGPSGQPDRFFVTADSELSIEHDFAEFGDTIQALRKRLRVRPGVRLYDHFPEYGKAFRRALGIESEQAMDLFHRTVSMKSVGSLDDFVRSHMLESFDAKRWIDDMVAHFQDLTKTHDAVVKARAQLEELDPLLADCDSYDELAAEIERLRGERAALPFFCAQHKAGLLERRIEELEQRIGELEGERDRRWQEMENLRRRRGELEVERAGHGGDRLAQIERQLTEEQKIREERRGKYERFNEQLTEAGLPTVERADQFPARRQQIGEEFGSAGVHTGELQNRMNEVGVDLRGTRQDAEELNTELLSLRGRRSNLPSRSLELRSALCRQVDVPESTLPFAGELIQVRPEYSEWEGAAERLLRGFGMSLLVPDEHYRAVSDWINANHLGARLVYYRVPSSLVPRPSPAADDASRQLFSRLEIKPSGFYPWLEQELWQRAGLDCVETMDEFRRARRAITKAGQIKGGGGRHEKDDRYRIDDRGRYVLGWSNESKIEALMERAMKVQQRQNELSDELSGLRLRQGEAMQRHAVLAKLDEVHAYTELDWQGAVARIEDLTAERKRLEAASGELHRLGQAIEAVDRQIRAAEKTHEGLVSRIGAEGNRLESERAELDRTRKATDRAAEVAKEFLAHLERRIDVAAVTSAYEWDRVESSTERQLTTSVESRSEKQRRAQSRAEKKMSEFRQRYPAETMDMDSSILSAGEYRELHHRLVNDDLPRFEAQFKKYLNENTIRDIANFQARLRQQEDLIKERIGTINESLVGISYNPGRYIRLELHPTQNVEIRDFRAELRACTDDSVSGGGSEQYSEQKFLQVKRIIERFEGREGQTDLDRAWARRVTDVRNWFAFSASERWREDDREHENYTDSGGKSGGQKEKLAYTILAASLAYQFKLEWGVTRSKAFQFVVIDEAFGRGSDESTRFGLQLFQQLGLQLLIVTPLQKIHVIEPYVSAVGLVDNTSEGDFSRLHTLTIEEYRRRKAEQAGRPRESR